LPSVWEALLKSFRTQPRHPAGTSRGGQWRGPGGDVGGFVPLSGVAGLSREQRLFDALRGGTVSTPATDEQLIDSGLKDKPKPAKPAKNKPKTYTQAEKDDLEDLVKGTVVHDNTREGAGVASSLRLSFGGLAQTRTGDVELVLKTAAVRKVEVAEAGHIGAGKVGAGQKAAGGYYKSERKIQVDPSTAGYSSGVFRHEFGHALDLAIRERTLRADSPRGRQGYFASEKSSLAKTAQAEALSLGAKLGQPIHQRVAYHTQNTREVFAETYKVLAAPASVAEKFGYHIDGETFRANFPKTIAGVNKILKDAGLEPL
jgi:hypothetical protein